MASLFQANGCRLSNEDTVLQGDSGLQQARQASSSSDKPQLSSYDLQYQLGRGSFGQVWAGTQKSTGQAVAIKFFLEGDLSYIRRELDRLREVSDHFAVVGLVDADLDHQPPYLVMPLLARSLAEEPKPARAQAARWLSQLAAGLRHSHEKGLLHCDLKPSNVMLDESGTARLVDFGQSRQQGDGVVAWGTLGYMAPEQAALGTEQEHSSPATAWDIYGLGATMYRLLTGFCPYWSEEELSLLTRLPLAQRLRKYRQHLQLARLIPVRRVHPQVDPDLADLVEACLRKDPSDRPDSMGSILEDLRRRDQGLPLHCRRPWSWTYLAYKWSRRPALVAATLATVGLVGSGLYSYQRIRRANQELRENVQQLTVQQAMQAQRSQEFEEAQLWWCQALKNRPDDPVLRMRLGLENFGLVSQTDASDPKETEVQVKGLKLKAPALQSVPHGPETRVLEPPYWSRWSASGELLERAKFSGDDPLLSPEGSWLRAGDRLISLDGQPDWKPEGQFLCFVGDRKIAVRDGARVMVVGPDAVHSIMLGVVEGYEAVASENVLLTADDERFQLWNANTGEFLTTKRMSNSRASPRSLEFSPDGALLTGCDNTVTKIWRVDPPTPQWVAPTPGTLRKLSWGPGQQWLWAGAENGIARIGRDGKVLEQRPWAERAFSYDMNAEGLGVAELEGSLQLFWPGGSRELVNYQPGQFEEFCQRVYFSGELLVASLPGMVKVWRVEGQKVVPLKEVAIAEPPQALAVSADGRYLAALCGKTSAEKLQLGVWHLPDLRGVPLAVSEIPFRGQPLQLAFGPDSRWLVAGCAGDLFTLALREPRQLGHWQMALFPDSPLLVGSNWMLACPNEPSLQKVNLPDGSAAGRAWPLTGQVRAMAVRGDLAAVSFDTGTKLIDLRDGNELVPALGTPGLDSLVWDSEGLLGGRDETVGYWSLPLAGGTPEQVTTRWEKLTGLKVSDLFLSR
ncbi:hypothetical protein ABS71_07715 [bacterium SCN 62-11]|nr:MAG: hypothetical protein ABS71_07715 [bacterium SCN 62-11]